jgi:hypothetical protein
MLSRTTTSALEQALAIVERALCREVLQAVVQRDVTPSLSMAPPLRRE